MLDITQCWLDACQTVRVIPIYFLFTTPRVVKRKYCGRKARPARLRWVDRNDGNGFVFLVINTDPTPLPAPGTNAVWNYKAIYRLHDEQVGQWSDVVSVTVGR